MNELSELLKERAASVHDDGAAERVAAVHHRVGVVRRRRASGVVAAALVAIAGVVGLNLHQEQPAVTPSGAPTTLVGRDVPRTVTTQEGTFRYVAGYTGADGSLAAELKATTTPRVLRVATEGESGTVSLGTGGDDRQTYPAGDFGYTSTAATDIALTWRVRSSSHSPVALAVYELAEPPAGYTKAGHTFPKRLGGGDLIVARIGDPGQSEVSAQLPAHRGEIALGVFCSGLPTSVPNSAMVWVGVNGKEQVGLGAGGCRGASDRVLTNANGSRATLPAGRVSVWLGDRNGKRLQLPAGATIGFSVYTTPVIDRSTGLPLVMQYDGHLWSLGGTTSSKSQVPPVKVDTTNGPALVSWSTADQPHARGYMASVVDGKVIDQSTAGGTLSALVATGKRSTVSLGWGEAHRPGPGTIGVYSLID